MAQAACKPERAMWSKKFTYDYWMESTGVPIHTGFFVDDLRTVELGWGEEPQCIPPFTHLLVWGGGVSSRITEIPAGESTRPLKFALDEVVYVVAGRGLTTIWYDNSGTKKSFEWQQHSMFLLPHGCHHTFSNMQGGRPVRLFHYSYLPLALSAVPDPDFFFNDPRHTPDTLVEQDDFYSEAKMVQAAEGDEGLGLRVYWYGNFFPDMRAWDKLEANVRRGAGGRSVYIQFPYSEVSAHLSGFAAQP